VTDIFPRLLFWASVRHQVLWPGFAGFCVEEIAVLLGGVATCVTGMLTHCSGWGLVAGLNGSYNLCEWRVCHELGDVCGLT